MLINRYKDVDAEKTQLLGRVQGLEQDTMKWRQDYEGLTDENEELQRAMDKVEEELAKSKKGSMKHEANYRGEKAKRKEIDKDRDKLNEKLRTEREQTRKLNNEILQIKMQYNEIDA